MILKRIIPTRIREELCEIKYRIISIIDLFSNRKKIVNLKKKKKIVYLMTPTHRNIGDAAIALGALELYRKVFINREIVEFTDYEVQTKRYYIKAITNKDDIVILHGGGNLGDWYPAWELLRQDIIRLFNGYKVILMPQTISFGNRKDTKWILKKAINTYHRYPLYRFICRDKKSYDFARDILKVVNLSLMPDSALILERIQNTDLRNDRITLCLRQDIEKNRTDNLDLLIWKTCEKYTNQIFTTDTIADTNISPEDRKSVVINKIQEFAGSKLVITDRYHGVIFSYLAKCPCLVLGNKDTKVKEAMIFFKDLNYINFVEDYSQIADNIEKMIGMPAEESIDYYERYFRGVFLDEIGQKL